MNKTKKNFESSTYVIAGYSWYSPEQILTQPTKNCTVSQDQ